jgi:nucleotide-binding universal stress UspA family protein
LDKPSGRRSLIFWNTLHSLENFMSFNKILVAINHSPLSPHAFTAALELAQSNQAALRLIHCIATEMIAEPTVPMSYDPGLQPTQAMGDYQTQQLLIEQQIEAAQTLLAHYRQEALNQAVIIEADYHVGDAGHLLCQVAKDWQADLIVVGRRGRSGLAEALLGSVSNYVVHHAPCSVLVIQEVESQTRGEVVSELS